jgi:hypothetical protein
VTASSTRYYIPGGLKVFRCDYRQYNLNYTPTTLGVQCSRERKVSNTTVLSHWIQTDSGAHSLLLRTHRVLLSDGKGVAALEENQPPFTTEARKIQTRFYNAHWIYKTCRIRFSVKFYSGALANYQLQSTVHCTALNPLGLLSHTSPLVPASNGGRSFPLVPELFPSNSHSDSLTRSAFSML